MQNKVITRSDQISADWLTTVLTRSGALEAGSVQSVTVETSQRELSSNARLALTYTANAEGNLPRRLFLKIVNTDMEEEFFGPSEVHYYLRDYSGVRGAPIPRSYDGAYSEEQRGYHVLMDDLSETHTPSYNREPSLEHGLALAEGLAIMHAHWWSAKKLEAGGESIPDAEAVHRFVEVARPGAEHILKACADQLEAGWSEAIRELYRKHPALMVERTRKESGFTLIHGDTNLSNVLIPIEGHRPIYILDRQPFDWSLTTWLGVYDLSYTMVLKWEPEIRRALEQPILKHYHRYLIQNGVHGYSWEDLFEDYRLSAGMSVYVATEWCRGGVNWETYPYWMPMLKKSMTAYDDLNCAMLYSDSS